jgi:hypothetical protein
MSKIIRTKTVDMGPDAIKSRLEDLAALYELGVSLMTARVIGPAASLQRDASDAGLPRPRRPMKGWLGRSA